MKKEENYYGIRQLVFQIKGELDYIEIYAKKQREKLEELDIILSEQEQPELEKEIVRFLSNSTKMNKGEWRGKYAISDIGFRAVAHHFYELGHRKTKEESK